MIYNDGRKYDGDGKKLKKMEFHVIKMMIGMKEII